MQPGMCLIALSFLCVYAWAVYPQYAKQCRAGWLSVRGRYGPRMSLPPRTGRSADHASHERWRRAGVAEKTVHARTRTRHRGTVFFKRRHARGSLLLGTRPRVAGADREMPPGMRALDRRARQSGAATRKGRPPESPPPAPPTPPLPFLFPRPTTSSHPRTSPAGTPLSFDIGQQSRSVCKSAAPPSDRSFFLLSSSSSSSSLGSTSWFDFFVVG